MKAAKFDFFLPDGFIADRPAAKRDDSRLLVLSRKGTFEHRLFSDLPDYLRPGDMLILNNSKVFPAKFYGLKPTGGKIEFLLEKKVSERSWQVLMKEAYSGYVTVNGSLRVHINRDRTVTFETDQNIHDIAWQYGVMPLPPYIKRRPDDADKERYQTVYAKNEGSIAAPTAGLHFTSGLLDEIGRKGVLLRSVTLHVGTGTFKPLKAEEIEDHKMDIEHFAVSERLLDELEETKRKGNRVITVGTTTTRALEGYLSGRCICASENGIISGTTDIFIYEGFRFMAADALLTNFHLPRSTPLMLAAAFAGHENLLNSYKEAISGGYRFFSYGDAMLVL